MNTQSNYSKVVFSGVITPASWDKEDKVNKFAVYTSEGEDIIIRYEDSLAPIIPMLLKKKVKISGRLVSQQSGYKVVQIENMEVLEDKKYNVNWKARASLEI